MTTKATDNQGITPPHRRNVGLHASYSEESLDRVKEQIDELVDTFVEFETSGDVLFKELILDFIDFGFQNLCQQLAIEVEGLKMPSADTFEPISFTKDFCKGYNQASADILAIIKGKS